MHANGVRSLLFVLAIGPFATCANASNEPYCGLYCVAAAMHQLGRPCEIQSLVDARFIGSPSGSSSEELVSAVEACGGRARARIGLGKIDLHTTGVPLILHVRPPGFGAAFSHWVLLLRVDAEKVTVFDGSAGSTEIQLGDFLANWDGHGIFVANRDSQLWLDETIRVLWRGLGASIVLGAVYLALASIAHRRQGFDARRSMLLIVSMSSACSFVAWLYANPGSLHALEIQHRTWDLPELGRKELTKSVELESAVIIDSRTASAFQRGTIPGAISLPVNASLQRKREVLAEIGRRPCIVFCQSAGCKFSDIVANELRTRGAADVGIYRAGFVEWEAHRRRSHESS